jgi:uncharacterized protein (DUF1015 family)
MPAVVVCRRSSDSPTRPPVPYDQAYRRSRLMPAPHGSPQGPGRFDREEYRVPQVRAFRALRFDPEQIDDMRRVVCPPYDVIGPELQRNLLDRHPYNAVRIDLPEVQAGEGPDDRYRRVSRTVAAWRVEGVLRKEPLASIYVYEQTYIVPGSKRSRTQRGFLARLRLEELVRGAGVLPHERTLSGPKEDRYKLLRATGMNTSPVVGIYSDSSGRSERAMAAIAAGGPDVEVTDDDGVRHKLWAAAEDGPNSAEVAALLGAASRKPVTIADGHHRYETALRYRTERRANKTGEADPAADYVLMLFLESARQKLTVLPTHRVARRLGEEGVRDLLDHAEWLFEVQPVDDRSALEAAFFSVEQAQGGRGRFGLWTRHGGALLRARRDAFDPSLPAGGEALRRLDVTLLQVALDRLCGISASGVAGGRLAYTKSVPQALDWVDAGADGADAAFLLDPTPVADISAVAAEGDVMPQKSTYFYPKALSGLVMNPHEW